MPWRPSPSGCKSTVMSANRIDQSGAWVKPVYVKQQRTCDRSSNEEDDRLWSVEWRSTADEGGSLHGPTAGLSWRFHVIKQSKRE
ncbi:hypothetical protein AGR2A_Lc80136 [Agrobacterium genomosp. 2 str. CFBP 5494]|uniref:Uncharacterized protein n=1 Tax=Agrobacterium genomosp. 2 str. CFBP 5494 TaxID=1183436 RepID=A0A9W5F2V3_9HYPH|nr:hypothetical protein AGR2A_Lc80136 [Agrobacterium genomosp. 2 str. CFBP 5494]